MHVCENNTPAGEKGPASGRSGESTPAAPGLSRGGESFENLSGSQGSNVGHRAATWHLDGQPLWLPASSSCQL